MMDKGILPRHLEGYNARRVYDNRWTYGMAVLPINMKRSFLVHVVEENKLYVDGAPCLCYYETVIPDTVIELNKKSVLYGGEVLKKIMASFLLIICTLSCLTGCENKNDRIEIMNKDSLVFDNINIDIKNGYFYEKHENFTVDDNTIGVTICFSNSEDDSWE